MTSEKKAALIRNGIILLLVIGIPVAVFNPFKKKLKEHDPKAPAETTQTTSEAEEQDSKVVNFDNSSKLRNGEIAGILDEASKKRDGLVLGIIHCHVPGNPESEEIADILNRVAGKYGAQVKVIRVDIIAFPEVAKAQKVTKPPKVVMMAGAERACKFQGLWTQSQIERKVDELLHGLRRVGRDWRPEVKGMEPMSMPSTPAPR